jgi:alpha-tubulin suppressor-like RCC1 family protein
VDYAIDVDAGDSSAAIVEIAVSSGGVCRLDTRGAVACMGRNIDGELGDDDADPYRATMGPVRGLPGKALHVTAGLSHHCALVEDLTLWCWGWNYFSQLGVGDTADRSHPARVTFSP